MMKCFIEIQSIELNVNYFHSTVLTFFFSNTVTYSLIKKKKIELITCSDSFLFQFFYAPKLKRQFFIFLF